MKDICKNHPDMLTPYTTTKLDIKVTDSTVEASTRLRLCDFSSFIRPIILK